MKFLPTQIPEVIEIQPEIHGDHRGYFMETFQKKHFDEVGIPNKLAQRNELTQTIYFEEGSEEGFVQDNESCSAKHTLRGLHYQLQHPQGKLVRVISGKVFDVAVDLRKSSATFGQWAGVELCSEKKNQLWVPPGFAHGFLVLSESATFVYKCTDYYAPKHERCLLWNDPSISIRWPISAGTKPLLSEKDQLGKLLHEAEAFE